MPCTAGRTPAAACGEPDDGAAYAQACPSGHEEDIRLCSYHALRVLEPGEFPVYCIACWKAEWVLRPVTITIKEET